MNNLLLLLLLVYALSSCQEKSNFENFYDIYNETKGGFCGYESFTDVFSEETAFKEIQFYREYISKEKTNFFFSFSSEIEKKQLADHLVRMVRTKLLSESSPLSFEILEDYRYSEIQSYGYRIFIPEQLLSRNNFYDLLVNRVERVKKLYSTIASSYFHDLVYTPSLKSILVAENFVFSNLTSDKVFYR